MVTVNVPLERFKELESSEDALKAILKNKQQYSIYYNGYDRIYYLNSLDVLSKELAEKMQKAIEDRDYLINKWKTSDPKSFNKINK